VNGSVSPSILVTGGTGVYGRSLVRRLVSEGHSVRVLTRSDKFSQHPNISTYRGDIACLEDVKEAIRGCDAIFHCAGEKYDVDRMESVNATGTRNLIGLAADLRIGFFCHLSSVGVTGRTRLKVVDEESPPNPMNLYEETKLKAEEIVRSGLGAGRAVILRPTNIFASVTLEPLLAQSVRNRLAMFLKGGELAHFVYVEDVVAAALYCWRSAAICGLEVFIVSSDEDAGAKYREILATLSLLTGNKVGPAVLRTSPPQILPYWLRRIRGINSNRGDVIYSSAKLRSAGFHFPFGLTAGLIHAVSVLQDTAPSDAS
jgi:nucleoside-diphosphate-sugar epimerase